MPKESNTNELELKKKSYIESVDGLRAVSIIFVMLYHLMPHVFAGGYLGVLVFFVLSGYFMTDNLLSDFDKGQKFQFFEFYKSRFSKLYTTYLPFLCMVSFVILGFFHEALIHFSENVVSAVFGFNNIYQIVNGLSYFETHGVLNPFTHLWFMGVELQFYLFYPILLRVFYKVTRGKKADIFMLLFLLSLVSAGLMYVNYMPEADISRIYYGTDTRVFSLLVGGFFACAFPKSALRTLRIKKWQGVFYTFCSMVFLCGIVWCMFMLDSQIIWLYPFGMYGFSVFSAMFLILLMLRRNLVANLLSIKLFTYFGSRSFSLYLWQYAIMVFVNAQFIWSKIDPVHLLALNLAITLVISEISYQLFEKKREAWRFKRSNRIVLASFSVLIMIALALPQYYPDYFVARDELSDLKRIIKEAQDDDLQTLEGANQKDNLVADLGSGVNDATDVKKEISGKKELSLKNGSKSDPREHDELNYEKLQAESSHRSELNQNVDNKNDIRTTKDQERAQDINKLISESKNTDDALKKMFEEDEKAKKITRVKKQKDKKPQPEELVKEQVKQQAQQSGQTAQGDGQGQQQSQDQGQQTTQEQQLAQGQQQSQDQQSAQTQQGQNQKSTQAQEQTQEQPREEEQKSSEEAQAQPQESAQETKTEEVQTVSEPFTFVGDSVMLGSKPNIEKVFTNCVVNAKVSRQAHHLYDVLHGMDNRGELYDNVVIHLGTNGKVDKDMLIRAIESLGDRRVYLINAVVPRSWEGQVNQVIQEVADELPNVSVIDWYGYAKGKKELFYKDATHPELIGREKYTELIRKSID